MEGRARRSSDGGLRGKLALWRCNGRSSGGIYSHEAFSSRLRLVIPHVVAVTVSIFSSGSLGSGTSWLLNVPLHVQNGSAAVLVWIVVGLSIGD